MRDRKQGICWQCWQKRELNSCGLCDDCWEIFPFIREGCNGVVTVRKGTDF